MHTLNSYIKPKGTCFFRNSAKSREGALLAFECLCETLGKLFEPYVIQMLPLLLVSFSDQVVAVREAAECAARAMMSQLTAQGVKLILPSLLKGLEDKAWRTKQSSVQLLGAMAYCAPQQLSQCLPKIVPKLTEVLTDTHPKVQSAGQTALQQVGSVIKNPEISALVPTLLMGLTEPNEHTKYSLDILLQTTFVNTIDAPSLALLVPIVHRGLRERSAETKKKAAQIVGNMCSLVTEPKDMIPYIGLLLPEVKKVLLDPIPEVRSVAARAIGSLIRGMGEENFPDLVPWLLDTLKSDGSNVERSGAAQGLGEVLAALGIEYFETILPDIIRNCSHQKASVRDGYLTLFRYLPRSLGVQFQNYLQQVLPAIIDGLADENESVRDAALGAGHVLVEHYATTSLPLLLPAVEEGIFNDNWRIRQSSVELLGDLLFKVAGTSGKAHLEGGSDDEGSSTEAHGRAIIEVLGREKRNEVLAALYMVRTDVSITVRQAALHVWKTIVANTPKTLKEIMPVLMSTLISSLASSSSERRQVAGRALGELVRKLGERVLPLIIPILSKGLNDPNPGRRQVSLFTLWAIVLDLLLKILIIVIACSYRSLFRFVFYLIISFFLLLLSSNALCMQIQNYKQMHVYCIHFFNACRKCLREMRWEIYDFY
nr:eIF-2-alpha kinase activator GCN1 isoform X17 [Ipomoea batatas]